MNALTSLLLSSTPQILPKLRHPSDSVLLPSTSAFGEEQEGILFSPISVATEPRGRRFWGIYGWKRWLPYMSQKRSTPNLRSTVWKSVCNPHLYCRDPSLYRSRTRQSPRVVICPMAPIYLQTRNNKTSLLELRSLPDDAERDVLKPDHMPSFMNQNKRKIYTLPNLSNNFNVFFRLLLSVYFFIFL